MVRTANVATGDYFPSLNVYAPSSGLSTSFMQNLLGSERDVDVVDSLKRCSLVCSVGVANVNWQCDSNSEAALQKRAKFFGDCRILIVDMQTGDGLDFLHQAADNFSGNYFHALKSDYGTLSVFVVAVNTSLSDRSRNRIGDVTKLVKELAQKFHTTNISLAFIAKGSANDVTRLTQAITLDYLILHQIMASSKSWTLVRDMLFPLSPSFKRVCGELSDPTLLSIQRTCSTMKIGWRCLEFGPIGLFGLVITTLARPLTYILGEHYPPPNLKLLNVLLAVNETYAYSVNANTLAEITSVRDYLSREEEASSQVTVFFRLKGAGDNATIETQCYFPLTNYAENEGVFLPLEVTNTYDFIGLKRAREIVGDPRKTLSPIFPLASHIGFLTDYLNKSLSFVLQKLFSNHDGKVLTRNTVHTCMQAYQVELFPETAQDSIRVLREHVDSYRGNQLTGYVIDTFDAEDARLISQSVSDFITFAEMKINLLKSLMNRLCLLLERMPDDMFSTYLGGGSTTTKALTSVASCLIKLFYYSTTVNVDFDSVKAFPTFSEIWSALFEVDDDNVWATQGNLMRLYPVKEVQALLAILFQLRVVLKARNLIELDRSYMQLPLITSIPQRFVKSLSRKQVNNGAIMLLLTGADADDAQLAHHVQMTTRNGYELDGNSFYLCSEVSYESQVVFQAYSNTKGDVSGVGAMPMARFASIYMIHNPRNRSLSTHTERLSQFVCRHSKELSFDTDLMLAIVGQERALLYAQGTEPTAANPDVLGQSLLSTMRGKFDDSSVIEALAFLVRFMLFPSEPFGQEDVTGFMCSYIVLLVYQAAALLPIVEANQQFFVGPAQDATDLRTYSSGYCQRLAQTFFDNYSAEHGSANLQAHIPKGLRLPANQTGPTCLELSLQEDTENFESGYYVKYPG